jgi:predicted ATPase
VVDRLQREGAPSLDRAEGTPLEAEITHAWKRGLSASTTFADSPDSLDMIGRERELAELRRLLTAGKTRLFTVTGPSGIGKSCLLRRLRREVESQFRDGSKLVGCGAIESAEDFCRAIGGPALPSSSLSALIEGLGNSHLLLMLDGADALSAHTPLLEAILAGCPNVRIVSSSRGPLGASGEHVFPLAPLQIDAEAAGSSDALKLFANAAAAADRKFELTGRTLHLAQEICRRTMGVPLALIIAAGCLAELSLSDVSRDLGQIPAKQTQVTAFNAVEGTLRLLSHTDVRMVRLLHVFAGLFSFEEARLVIGATDDDVSEFLHRMRNCGLLAKYED